MEDRRRLLSGWPNHSTRTSSHSKPPHPPGSAYYHSVPAWEKRFCTSVCSIPWQNICNAKILISIHKNIANWDDSGALEAFHNAKARFLAQEINHGSARCDDIPPPDPDMYIDNVDFDAPIDPDLVADLENDQPPLPGGGCIIFANKPVPGIGWGNAECSAATTQNNTGAEPFTSGWDSKPNRGIDNADTGNAWDNSWGAGGDNTWDKGWGSNCGNDNEGSGNAWNDYSWGVGQRDNSWDNGNNGSRGTWENKNNNTSGRQRKGRKRDGGHFGFKSMKRLRVDNYQMNDNRHWLYDKQPPAMR